MNELVKEVSNKKNKASKYQNLEAEFMDLFIRLPASILEAEFPHASTFELMRARNHKRMPRTISPIELIKFIEKYL